MSLLKELKRVRKKMQDPKNWDHNGFCMHMNGNRYSQQDLYSLFIQWPKFSGAVVFPVGNGMTDYMEYGGRGRFWDRENSEYAALRWELLEFCIAKLEPIGSEEGDTCNRNGCTGTIQLSDVENCSCHVNAPCVAHMSTYLYCDGCEWVDGIDDGVDVSTRPLDT